MSTQKEQVRKFYSLLWDARELASMPSILHEEFTFRGSLGQEKKGHRGFAEYVEMVHQALGEYRCVVEQMVEEGAQVFAKMTFTGVHRAQFMGYPPSHKRVSWHGCALFTFESGLVSDLWVLGDLKGLEDQLKANATDPGSA